MKKNHLKLIITHLRNLLRSFKKIFQIALITKNSKIFKQMILQKLAVITFQEGANQKRYMEKRQKEGKLDLGDYAAYFVGGIKKKRTSQQSALEERILAKAAKELKEKKERKERERQTKRPPVYNWLEQ